MDLRYSVFLAFMILSSQESEERFRGAATIAKDFLMKLTKREIKVVKKL